MFIILSIFKDKAANYAHLNCMPKVAENILLLVRLPLYFSLFVQCLVNCNECSVVLHDVLACVWVCNCWLAHFDLNIFAPFCKCTLSLLIVRYEGFKVLLSLSCYLQLYHPDLLLFYAWFKKKLLLWLICCCVVFGVRFFSLLHPAQGHSK